MILRSVVGPAKENITKRRLAVSRFARSVICFLYVLIDLPTSPRIIPLQLSNSGSKCSSSNIFKDQSYIDFGSNETIWVHYMIELGLDFLTSAIENYNTEIVVGKLEGKTSTLYKSAKS